MSRAVRLGRPSPTTWRTGLATTP